MPYEGSPEIGEWYRRLDRPQPFHVVAMDDEEGVVEVEYFDGTIDEWPLTHWQELEIEPCDAPQDWTGAFDDVDRSDLEDLPAREPEDWREALEDVDADLPLADEETLPHHSPPVPGGTGSGT